MEPHHNSNSSSALNVFLHFVGIVFRSASSKTYFAALFDFTETGPQVLLRDTKENAANEFATVVLAAVFLNERIIHSLSRSHSLQLFSPHFLDSFREQEQNFSLMYGGSCKLKTSMI